jgi:RHH-type proline utilization regulon transcriptional repressor/proline dehydrogenase/delta 1-pyrroline-5-carboxylate dehydrogenase
MVESIRQVIKRDDQKMVVYGTAARRENFTNAIAYLVRRLDENTGEQNFLRYSFALEVNSPQWEKLKNLFVESVKRIETVSNEPTRTQDRNVAPNYEKIDFSKFVSEIDTDFVLTQNRKWALGIAEKWKNIAAETLSYGSVIGGVEDKKGSEVIVYDNNAHPEKKVVGVYYLASGELLKGAVGIAADGFKLWTETPFEDKLLIFEKALNLFRKNRGDLIGIAAAEVGKVFTETDVEVSEAIDFIYFYTHAMKTFKDSYPHIKFNGLGIGLVISPWNFPVAIPTGGIMTSLISGNATLFKPASLTTLTGRALCEIFWEAGVPKNVLQFIAAKGSAVEESIIKDPNLSFAVFTGSETTAYKILKSRPDLLISAETGGKDATIVTSVSDRDQAIKNLLHSAFSNSGQKCSATSLLVLEDDVYNDKSFKQTLKDAALNMKVGSCWELGNKLSTLSDLPSGDLKTAIEDKEGWLVPPSFENNNPYLMRPAVKWGVQRGSHCHMKELFGPVLSVMKAKDLKEAVEIVNETGYGLTSGLESLDEREWEYWKENLKAGNLYINRGTTGAIVLRQPFGGLRKSCVGLGRKAGTYNYIAQFCDIKEKEVASHDTAPYDKIVNILASGLFVDVDLLKKVSANYEYNARNIFNKVIDPMKIRGEDNEFRYLKVNEVVIRYYSGESGLSLALAILAVRALNIRLVVSTEEGVELKLDGIDVVSESESSFYKRFKEGVRVRYLSQKHIKDEAYEAIYALGGYFASKRVISEGRFELLNYLLEQSISTSYHRYGNLGARKLEVSK